MVEKIELLNNLSRVELIKLLNIDNMKLNDLLDLRVRVNQELNNKYDNIDKIEFRDEYNGFYNMNLSDEYKNCSHVGMMDLIKLINLSDMSYCELLYLNVMIEDAIDNKYLKNHDYDFLNGNKMLYLNDSGICGFGKISFVNYNNLLYGVDTNYNFYVGKIDKEGKCILFNVLRKGIPDDLCNDVLVFKGNVLYNNSLDGNWSIGSNNMVNGINDINNMNNANVYNTDKVIDMKDLYLAYISCGNYTNTLNNLLDKINNKRVNRMVR